MPLTFSVRWLIASYMLGAKHGGSMDYGYAKNYWRRAFVEKSNGRFTAAEFDEWFPGEPGVSEFQDHVLEAFDLMLRACAKKQFSGQL